MKASIMAAYAIGSVAKWPDMQYGGALASAKPGGNVWLMAEICG